MPDPRHSLGRAAEDRVAAWLTSQGWRILARRHTSPSGGEVDVIALDPGGVLVAIEVRARRTRRTGPALESVDSRRAGRLGRTLAAFAASTDQRHVGLRVDLVSVEPREGSPGQWLARRLAGIG